MLGRQTAKERVVSFFLALGERNGRPTAARLTFR